MMAGLVDDVDDEVREIEEQEDSNFMNNAVEPAFWRYATIGYSKVGKRA